MKSSNICYCTEQSNSKILPGYCSTCYGTLADTPESKVKPSTLEELINLKSQFLESAYQKTLKVMKMFKSSSSPQLPDYLKHKRSNTSNKLLKNKDLVPEEGAGINKVNCLKVELHPNSRSSAQIFTSGLPVTLNRFQEKPKEDFEKTKSISFKNFVSKHHDRALSSKIGDSVYSSKNDLWLPPDSLISKWQRPKPDENLEFFHTGHRNSVNCLAILQGKVFSAGSDYSIIHWPSIDTHLFMQHKAIYPAFSIKGHSRPIRCLIPFNNRNLISSGQQNKLKLWSLNKTLEATLTLTTPDPVTTCLLNTSSQLLSAGSAGKVHLWDINSKSIIKSHSASSKGVNGLIEFSHNLFISASNDGKASLIDFRCLRNVANFVHPEEVSCVLRCEDQSFYSAADKLRVRDM